MAERRARCAGPCLYGASTLAHMSGYAVAHLDEIGELSDGRCPCRGREAIEANPQYAEPLYNLACCESLSGRTTDAIVHLRQAIDRGGWLRPLARDDSDFDPIRDEPAFAELLGRD